VHVFVPRIDYEFILEIPKSRDGRDQVTTSHVMGKTKKNKRSAGAGRCVLYVNSMKACV